MRQQACTDHCPGQLRVRDGPRRRLRRRRTRDHEAGQPPRRPRPRPPPPPAAPGLLQRPRRRRRRPRRPRRPRLPQRPRRRQRGTGSPPPPPPKSPPPVEAPAPEAGSPRGRVEPQRRHRPRTAAATGRREPEPRRLGRRQRGRRRRRRRPAGDRRRPAPGDRRQRRLGLLDGGSPTARQPDDTIAPFGPAPIGVPNFVIDSFEIPPFLLPIYQACGTEYGIPWQVLASINKIETAFGTNLNVSSAGAMGWMQFIPSSWEAYGVDANGDGRKDPYNPVDAICAAANYLKAAGGLEDLYDAIFAYNHADWYVQEVLALRARLRQAPGRPDRLADRPHRGRPLPGRRRRQLRRRHLRPRGAAAGDARRARGLRQRRRRDLLLADPARDQHLRRRGRPGRRRQRRGDREVRQLGEARPLRRPPGRLRQPLHLRGARRDRPRGPHGRDADRRGEAGPGRQREHPAAALRPARAQRGRTAGAGRRKRRHGRLDRRRRQHHGRLEGDRRHRPGPDRRRRRRRRPPHQLLDPAGRPRRPADRPEADPRRLEAARGDGDLPRQGQEPVRAEAERRRRPAALQGGAAAPRARRPADRASPTATGSKSAPARSTGACWRRSPTSPSRASA